MNNQPSHNVVMDGATRHKREGNLAHMVQGRTKLLICSSTLISGMMASTIFAPFQFSWYAWLCLVPILFLGIGVKRGTFLLGCLFGFGHFATTFFWLRTVFIPAPVLMGAAFCVLPAAWLVLTKSLLHNLQVSRDNELLPSTDPTIDPVLPLHGWKAAAATLAPGLIWCATEWFRSWILTGLPWNQLGISQWQNGWLLEVSRFTGVYGISYLIVTVNMAAYLYSRRFLPQHVRERATAPIGLLIPLGIAMLAVVVSHNRYQFPDANPTVRIAAVQGNIPQIRRWTPEQLDHAIEVYTDLTRQIVAETTPDLILWPETAIPASLRYDEKTRYALRRLQRDIQTPLLAGTIDYRFPPEGVSEPARSYNSAILFDAAGRVIDWYDKIHLVPFGEYVPMERLWPQLNEWIGMGRSLSAGGEYTLLKFGQGARIGVNICYEDIFPEISRKLVQNGANLIVIITNDAWFKESSGSRQHLAHSVFRAVESCRPVLRNGNNSDTCLILPTGEITGLIYDADAATPFVRGARLYDVPIAADPPITWYTRHGDWFAILATVFTGACLAWCLVRNVDRKRKLYETITQ